MTAPEDQNGLREALARWLKEANPSWFDATCVELADKLIAGPLAVLIATRDAQHRASLRAAETELDEERQESARLALAVTEGQAEIARLRSALKFIAEPDHRQGMFLTGRSAQAIALRALSLKEQP